MRIGIFSDIHANAVAMKQVLEDICSFDVDQLVCLGDVVTLGPSPNEVIAMLSELKCHYISGNHDFFMKDERLLLDYTDAPIIIDAIKWASNQLSPREKQFFNQFQHQFELEVEGHKICFSHGSPLSCMHDVLINTPDHQLDLFIKNTEADIYAFGHTHIQMLRQYKGKWIINPGSVGSPFREYVGGKANVPTLMPFIEYAILQIAKNQISVEMKRLALDKKAYYQTIESSDHPMRQGWLLQYS